MVAVEAPPEQHLVMSFWFQQLTLLLLLLSLLTEGDYSAPCSWGLRPRCLGSLPFL